MTIDDEGTCPKCMGTTRITINHRRGTYDEYCPNCDIEEEEE